MFDLLKKIATFFQVLKKEKIISSIPFETKLDPENVKPFYKEELLYPDCEQSKFFEFSFYLIRDYYPFHLLCLQGDRKILGEFRKNNFINKIKRTNILLFKILPIFTLLFLVIFSKEFAYSDIQLNKATLAAQKIFSGLGYVRGYESEGCEWDRPPQISGKVEFGDTSIFYLKCLHGSYNAWFVYLLQENDGSFKPITFSYPEIIEVSLSKKFKPKIIGITNTYSLCNPTYNKKKMTISTMCKGRGIGDVATYGTWKLNIKKVDAWLSEKPKKDFIEFQLINFKADFTLDSKKNPITLLDFN